MPYIPFTDEQKQLANSVDLEQFLRMRGEKLERAGIEHKLIYYDSSGKHDSITLRGSTWFDHKNQIGGGAIKFMQEFYGMDFQTAVQELLGQTVTPLSHSPPKVSAKEEKKEKILSFDENEEIDILADDFSFDDEEMDEDEEFDIQDLFDDDETDEDEEFRGGKINVRA